LSELERAGLVTKKETPVKFAGRPKIVYALKESEVYIGFPARNFKTIQNVFLKTNNNYCKTKSALYDFYRLIAKEFATEFLRDHLTENNSYTLSFDNFSEKFIIGELGRWGALPEINEQTGQHIVYTLHNCPFGDSSLQGFEFVCNTLSRAFLSEIARRIGGIEFEILKTRHTKPYYCKFKVTKIS
ncbi:MAG: hypothetical protein ACTSQY_02360, partial [Candidatus Odinarchaeia archaeon]